MCVFGCYWILEFPPGLIKYISIYLSIYEGYGMDTNSSNLRLVIGFFLTDRCVHQRGMSQ